MANDETRAEAERLADKIRLRCSCAEWSSDAAKQNGIDLIEAALRKAQEPKAAEKLITAEEWANRFPNLSVTSQVGDEAEAVRYVRAIQRNALSASPAQEPKPATPNEAGLLPCPFCKSTDVDPRGWLRGDGVSGPACSNCGGSAETVELWNAATAQEAMALPDEPLLRFEIVDVGSRMRELKQMSFPSWWHKLPTDPIDLYAPPCTLKSESAIRREARKAALEEAGQLLLGQHALTGFVKAVRSLIDKECV